jgi:hypothetical protein
VSFRVSFPPHRHPGKSAASFRMDLPTRRHPGESRDPAAVAPYRASASWTPAFAGATTVVGPEDGNKVLAWTASLFDRASFRTDLPTLRHPGESRDPAAGAPSRASASWTPAFAGATTVVGPETDGNKVLAWTASLLDAASFRMDLPTRRHPGESRDPAAVASTHSSASWTPAFAGVTKVIGTESINS